MPADFSLLDGCSRLTKQTVEALMEGKKLEHKDLEWEPIIVSITSDGIIGTPKTNDILKIIRWPFALVVNNTTDDDGIPTIDLGIINLHTIPAGSLF